MLAASHVGKEMTSVTNRVEGGHGPDSMLQAIGVTEVTGHLLAAVSTSRIAGGVGQMCLRHRSFLPRLS